MSIINNMLKDLENRKGQDTQQDLESSSIRVTGNDVVTKSPIKIILATILVGCTVLITWAYINDEDFIEDVVYDFTELFNKNNPVPPSSPIVISQPAKQEIKPQLTKTKVLPIIRRQETKKPKKQLRKQPIAIAVPKLVKVQKKPESIVAKQVEIPEIQNVRYFSDGNVSRLVIDSTTDISPQAIRTYGDNNNVRFEFETTGIAQQTIQNNHSDKVIENFKIKTAANKTILSYRTLVKGTSKHHQIAPTLKPYHRFVITIRPQNKDTQIAKPTLTPATQKRIKNKTIETTSVKILNKKKLASSRWFHLAQIQYKKGQLTKAKNNLRKLLKNDPQHIEGYQLLANIYLQYGQIIDAKKILKGGFQYTKNTQIGIFYAQLLADSQQQDQALKVLQQLNQDTDSIEYLSLKAALLQQSKKHNQAVTIYLKLLEKNNNIGKWWMALALSLEAQNKALQAKNAYEQAITKPDMTSALLQYANKRLKRL